MVFSVKIKVLEAVGNPCFGFYRDGCHEMGELINELYSNVFGNVSGNGELPIVSTRILSRDGCPECTLHEVKGTGDIGGMTL